MRTSAMLEMIHNAEQNKDKPVSTIVNEIAEGNTISGVRAKEALEKAGFIVEPTNHKHTVSVKVYAKLELSDEDKAAGLADKNLVGFGQAGNESEAVLCAVRGMVHDELPVS